MPYGDWDAKITALQPLLERTRYIHGRIGNSCHMQLPVANGEAQQSVEDFHLVWGRAFEAYRRSDEHALPFIFAPELLPPPYAPLHPHHGQQEEYADRWLESLFLCSCMQEAIKTR